MSIPGEWFRRARYLVNRRQIEHDLRREMEAHREMLAAPARFGNTLQLREDAQDVWGWRWLDDLAQDVRYAVRTLAVSHRAFAVTGVLMLAVGIGVTTAVFSVVSGLLLRPLPFAQPERLVELHGTMARGPNWSQVRNLEAYRRDSTSFEGLASYDVSARYLRDAAGAERVMTVADRRAVLRRARRGRSLRAHLPARRWTGGGRDQRDLLAAASRRPRRCRRPDADAGRSVVHHRRRHAGLVPVSLQLRLASSTASRSTPAPICGCRSSARA